MLPRPPARGWALVGVVLALLAIAVATLTPQEISPTTERQHWCLVCGEIGGADTLSNVLLFTPLGLALAVLMDGRRAALARAVLAGAAVSIVVELLQLLVVPGRFATASDVVTNSTGTLVGALLATHWRAIVLPRRPAARALSLAATVGGAGLFWLTAWAFGRDASRGPLPPAPSPLFAVPGSGWYHGVVVDARIGGQRFGRDAAGPIVLAAALPAAPVVEASVRRRDERRISVAFVYVHGADGLPELTMSQRGDQLALWIALRARRLALRVPIATVHGAFGGDSTALLQATGGYRSGILTLAARRGAWQRRTVVRLSPAEGWSLLLPFVAVGDPLAVPVTVAWMALVGLAVAYCARWSRAAAFAPGAALVVGGSVLASAAWGDVASAPWYAWPGLALGWWAGDRLGRAAMRRADRPAGRGEGAYAPAATMPAGR